MPDYRDMRTQLRTELANLEIRREQLQTAIHDLDRLDGGGPQMEVDPSNPTPFRDMTYGDATAQLLFEHGELGTREIADLLLQGGMKTKARNFVATVYTLLYKDGRFTLEDKKWQLKASAKKQIAKSVAQSTHALAQQKN